MQYFDKEKNIHHLKKEFNLLDEFYFNLNNKLVNVLNEVIEKFYPDFNINQKSSEYFNLFSSFLINSTESVFYKDCNYPDYRIRDELKRMIRIAKKESKYSVNLKFESHLNQTIKKILVDCFPEIYDLTGNGFRLLEANTTITMHHFLSDFYLDDYFYK